MTRPLRTDLRLAFGVLLAVVALVGAGGVLAATVTATYVRQATDEVAPALRVNDSVLQSLTDMETGVRGYVLTGRRDTLDHYRQALRSLPRRVDTLGRLLADDPAGTRLFTEQARTARAWVQGYAVPRVSDPAGEGNFDLQRFQRGHRLFDRVRADNRALRRHLGARLAELRSDADNMRGATIAAVIVLTLGGLGVGVLTTRYTSRRVRRPLAALRDVLTDLTAGQDAARAVPSGPHEVATIARSVNALADETDRLRGIEAEERRLQERLLDFGRVVRGSLDPEEVVRLGLAELGESLRLDRAYVRLVEDGELQDVGAQWSAPGVDALGELATPGSISALHAIHRQRSPLTSSDVRQDAFFETDRGRHWVDATGARASMTLPIPVEDQPVGVITCIGFEPRTWGTAEIHLAEAVAADLGRALAHARLYTAQVAAVQRLEELDRTKDEFLSSVSHELRTPLTSINGYLELLEDDDPAPQQRRLLHVVRRNADRLRLLIEDLLTLSRIESGAFRSTLQETDVTALVQASVDDVRPQARNGGVDVHVRVPDSLVPVRADAGQLSRAMLNVVGNAIKFTPPGGRVDVEVRAEAEPGVVVEVRDTGIGIPEADLDRVFTRFFRASNAVASEVQGTGLGLVIVRTILDNHGGSLHLSSREGAGTTVRMTLPWSQPGAVVQVPQPSGATPGG